MLPQTTIERHRQCHMRSVTFLRHLFWRTERLINNITTIKLRKVVKRKLHPDRKQNVGLLITAAVRTGTKLLKVFESKPRK